MFNISSAMLVALSLLAGVARGADTPSAYAGMEARDIKALSAADIDDYFAGRGMGFAKAAELNHYPGPAHVLAMATELGLTADQRARTEALFKTMEAHAIALGKQIVDRERELDHLFATRTITPDKLRHSIEAIAVLQGRLRQVHLETHLGQAELLDGAQLRKYDNLRGYGEARNAGPATNVDGKVHGAHRH
jgi:Spy/CpxP family protein refolding chaperone